MGRGRRGNGREKFGQGGEAEAAAPEDDIVVIDESGAPVEDNAEIEVVHAEEVRQPAKRDEDPELSDFQRQFEELKAREAAKDAKLREYEQRDQSREADHLATQKALLEHASQSAQAELRDAKNRFKIAMASQDFDAASEAQAAISAATLDIRNYDMAKDHMESAVEAKRQPAPQQQAQQQGDQVEAYISNLPPKLGEWARKNRGDVFANPQRYQKAVSGHYAAVSEGMQPETPEYLAYLDKHMGYTQPATQRQHQERRPPMASAPVSRSGTPGGGNQVQLTAQQRQIAGRLGMTLTQYAKHLRTLQEKGGDPEWRGPRLSQFDANRG